MKIENMPVINKKLDCLESVLAALACWAEREYTFLLAETWEFRYESNHTDSRIGQHIRSYTQSRRFFESSSGITLTRLDYSTEDALDHIVEETKNGRPVMIGMNSYWCPWSTLYNKQPLLHYLFVTHYDHSSKSLVCIDPFFVKWNIQMPLDCYRNGYNRVLHYTIKDEIVQLSLNEVLSAAVHRLTSEDRATTAFQDMIRLADDIANVEDLKKDVEGYPIPGAAPLIYNTTHLAQGRFKFADFLRYAADHYQARELTGAAEEMQLLGSGWMLISTMLSKSVLQKNVGGIKNRIADKILRISEQEQSACEALKAVLIR